MAYASADSGSLTYSGASYGNSSGVGDGVGVIEPDKVGEIGVAFLKYYEFSGVVRFRNAAVQAADVLASHVRIGSATQSPWPFRVYAETDVIREQYTAHVIAPIRLFDELIRLNLGNVAAYRSARQIAWNWLMTYPIQNNIWSGYFEDVPIQSNTANVNQLIAGETARYLMQHPEFDPEWESHVRGIISWIEAKFAAPQYGANTIAEQYAFFYPMGSHTSRYASVNARLFELTGDQAALEKAYRSLNWATYMCASNGVVIDGPNVNHIWWTDGYGDYIKHFMESLGSVPEWAPQGESHLLRSTSVVRSVQYAPTDVTYQVFDESATEVLRLNFAPQSVTAGGVVLPQRSELSQEGWTFSSATSVMRVRHESSTQVRISGAQQNNNLPPQVSLDSPAPGNYLAPISFILTATANDLDGSVGSVEFLSNGTSLATKFAPPYEFIWTSVPPGSYQLSAAAVDDRGARTISDAVSVMVSSLSPVSAPTNLTATLVAGAVNLAWSPPTGGTVVNSYRVYRSTTSGYTPGASNLVGQTAVPAYSDGGLSPGIYFYRVVAISADGISSEPSTEASVTVGGSLQVDKVVFADGRGGQTTPAINTSKAGELLLAFAASDGPQSGGQVLTVSGAGLVWSLVMRVNTQPGSSEIWKAVAPAPLVGAAVSSTPSRAGYDQSLTVVSFSGAGGTGVAVGASGVNAPSVSLTTTRTGSLVYGVGNDWARAVGRTVGANQALVHQWVDTGVGDTYWVQRLTFPTGGAGTVVQLNDTAPTSGRWNLAAVEVFQPTGLVSVPSVVGQPQAAAQSQITGAGLTVGTVTRQSSATVPVDAVISQSPTGGTQVAGGSAVTLVVSSGPQLVSVPSVVGQPQAAAQSQITGAGLTVGTVTRQSSATVPVDAVISQSPTGGTQVAGGSAVTLVVSSGPQLVSVPSVVGQPQAAAQSQITGAGLTVGTVTRQSSATVPVDAVISQSPTGGTQVAGGSAVTLVVSSGPQLVSVPSVVGQPQAAAQSQITGAGLTVGTVTRQSSATVPVDAVISQSPTGGTQVAGGSAVTLVVSSGPQLVSVPSVVGQPQAAAQSQITGAGLTVGTVTRQSSATVPVDAVISQSPTGGTQVAGGSAVTLVVSSGPQLVSVPSVVGQPQAAAQSQITGAGLTVGTVTRQSSATVPVDAVISQSPTGGTQVAGGSAVTLVVSSGDFSVVLTPVYEQTISSDGPGTRFTPAFSTTSADELLLAFVASDGPPSRRQSMTVTGAGLTWTLVKRVNEQSGCSEIWQATATSPLANVTVTSTPAIPNYRQSLTVVTFKSASGLGASAAANAARGAPSVSLTTTKANSLVYGVGNDWDRAVARTVPTTQSMVYQWIVTDSGDTFWVQAWSGSIANAGTAIRLNDIAPTNDRWNFAAVEIVP